MVTPRSAVSDTYVAKIGVDADIATPIAATLTAGRELQRSTKIRLQSKERTGRGRRLKRKLESLLTALEDNVIV